MADRKARLAALKAAAGRGGERVEGEGSGRTSRGGDDDDQDHNDKHDNDKLVEGPPSERSGSAKHAEERADPTPAPHARDEEEQDVGTVEQARSALRFRNYAPTSAALASSSTELTSTASSSEPDGRGGSRSKAATTSAHNNRKRLRPGASSSVLEAALRRAQEQQPAVLDPSQAFATSDNMADLDDAVAVAPRKINWDLKRDIQPKLDKLERRTQRAIVALLRERLEQEAASATAAELD